MIHRLLAARLGARDRPGVPHVLRAVALLILGGLSLSCTVAGQLIPTPTPHPSQGVPETLTLAYPDSLAPVMTALASAYQRHDPEVQVVLLERADTLALQALEDRDVAIAALSWLPADALPEGSWHTVFARDGLAVIVNPQNGVPGVTMEQLQQLFQDRLEDWTLWDGRPGAPKLVSRSEASGDFAFFQRRVMQNARVALTALLAPSTDAMLALVAEDPMAVGYVAASRVDGRVRTLTVDGVPPAPEAIAAGLYPLTRAYCLVTLEEPQGAARAFVQWALGPEGQAVVQRQGLLALEE